MFVVGCRKFWMNQPDLLPEDKPLVCSREELLKIVELCDPLSKILYVQWDASVGAFGVGVKREGLIGPEKCKPVLQALGEAYPHLDFAIEPVQINNPWNSRWEHKVTVKQSQEK